MAGEPARLFLALWPPAEAQHALARWADGGRWPSGAQRVAAARLHVTLHFIGSVPAARVPQIVPALAVTGERVALEFGHLETWARGLVALLPHHVPPAAATLHARLAEALTALDLPVEARPWRPHVTLAREAAGAALPPPDWRWTATGYALVQSERGYTTLAHYPLR